MLNGIEAALWDLKGKLLGQPVHALLGGASTTGCRRYATGGPSNYPKDRLARKVDYYLSLGFRGFKVGAGSLITPEARPVHARAPAEAAEFEGDKARVHARARAAATWTDVRRPHGQQPTADVGPRDRPGGDDGAVEPFDLFFFEEPLHYTDPWGYAELCRATTPCRSPAASA